MIKFTEAEYADFQAQVRRMRGESDDAGPADIGGTGVVGADAGPVRRHPRTGSRRAAAGSLAQAPIRHEHVHTARPALDAPHLTGRWLRLLCTVAALAALAAQVGWDVDVPPGALLVSVLWLVIAYLTRRPVKRRGNGGFLWGALFGASVESMIHSAEELRR